MKKITFANSKGGVGKTTLTLNLINVLSQLNKKILVFDIDPQANLSRALLSNYTSKKNIELWFKNSDEKELLNSIEKTILKNVLIVPAYNNLVLETNTYVTAMSMGELILKNNLIKMDEILKKDIDYIFFDSFPSMNKILLNVLLASDEIIIPIEPHKFSYEGYKTIKEPYDNAIKTLNQLGLKITNNMNYFIFNKVQKNKTHEAVIQAINNSEIGTMVLKTKIPLSTTKQKETMLMKFISITDKNPIGFLTNELIEKGVL
ncbi:ParA family protein [Spiroplasma endosymbiont of Danaus chrysippus]|uniref:ParA family protein n=1 Tax=Spiroplasma endosymbiont of Danaus chrysippus TaxID=2691041 RepID=UPI00157AAEB3|nr:ParA family protein [Spiroplasma endosymbiont of Danaus chrysippus]